MDFCNHKSGMIFHQRQMRRTNKRNFSKLIMIVHNSASRFVTNIIAAENKYFKVYAF